MKFSNSTITVITELERQIDLKVQKINESLRKRGSILTTGNSDSLDFLFPKNKMDFMITCCLSHYLESPWKEIVQYELTRRRKRFGPDYEVKIISLLRSRSQMLSYVLESNVLGYTSSEVFGNLIASKPFIKLLALKNRKPKRLERHRGYRDHGSLAPDSSKHLREFKIDYSSTELQNIIEEKRKLIEDTAGLVEGFTMW